MSDITTKLRSALAESAFTGIAVVITAADCTEAADEIDRLRAANGDLQRWFDAAFSEFGRKDEVIARLREALSLALDEIRECDDTDGVRAKVIDVLSAMAESPE